MHDSQACFSVAHMIKSHAVIYSVETNPVLENDLEVSKQQSAKHMLADLCVEYNML